LDEFERAGYLASLGPGADIDHRGTRFDQDLLGALLDALRDPSTSQASVGLALFDQATFCGISVFRAIHFTADAHFVRAIFLGDAWFGESTFRGNARFDGVTFSRTVNFELASFSQEAIFRQAQFHGNADFKQTSFSARTQFTHASFADMCQFVAASFSGVAQFDTAHMKSAWFDEATFADNAWFSGSSFGTALFNRTAFSAHAGFNNTTFAVTAHFISSRFAGPAWFKRAIFRSAQFHEASFAAVTEFTEVTIATEGDFSRAELRATSQFGPLLCGDILTLTGIVFNAPVTMEIATRRLSLNRARWASTATIRLRYATVDLSGAVLEFPVTIAAEPTPFAFLSSGRVEPEYVLHGADPSVRISSVGGVDTAHLGLTDVDLSECRFAGAVHLEQLRIDGRADFARPPTGWHRRGLLPMRFSRRQVLAEEHHWRAAQAGQSAAVEQEVTARQWSPGLHHPDLTRTPGPRTTAALYRQLRKALEDGKNEPGAADFYYGECEMRRHDREGTPWAERALLTVYWAVSGYGLRASRALAWLGVAMAATVTVMMLWGLPAEDPKPATSGRQVGVDQELTLITDTPPPVNPSGPFAERLSTERFEKALRVVINSTVFRSSGQGLTTAGTYAEMASRCTEPVLLTLAVLAVRARVKR
jgi:hypothetical protein